MPHQSKFYWDSLYSQKPANQSANPREIENSTRPSGHLQTCSRYRTATPAGSQPRNSPDRGPSGTSFSLIYPSGLFTPFISTALDFKISTDADRNIPASTQVSITRAARLPRSLERTDVAHNWDLTVQLSPQWDLGDVFPYSSSYLFSICLEDREERQHLPEHAPNTWGLVN